MTKLFTAATIGTIALIGSLATPALASEAPAKRSFVRDGQTFVYTSTQKADRTILSGRRYPSGSAYTFVVRKGRVTGYSGGVPVSFALADVKSSASTEIASR